MEDTNYEWAMRTLKSGWKVRLPEWRGYWFADQDNKVWALTKDGEYKPAFTEDPGYKARTDWEIANGLDFGWAICALKAGKKVARKGWNGKGMFVFMRPADELDAYFVVEKVKSVPQSVKDYIIKHYTFSITEAVNGKNTVKFTSYLCMKNAQGEVMNGWAATQTDMLAEDWELVN